MMSSSRTAPEASATLAEKVSLFSRPQVTETMRVSTVTPAMRSAASTARADACSALSRWATMPAFSLRRG